MNRVAIIPARGGSKRLPRKNVLEIAGRPTLAYPVDCARRSGLFERIIVSTEDKEIGEIAASAGAEIMNRPPELASDQATVAQVCLNVLRELDSAGTCPDVFCCIYATAVLLEPEDLVDSEARLEQTGADIVMGVSVFTIHPFKALRTAGNFLQPMFLDEVKKKGQAYPELVASNGTLYWARSRYFLEQPDFYAEKCAGYEVPPARARDIDTAEDYARVCELMNARAARKASTDG